MNPKIFSFISLSLSCISYSTAKTSKPNIIMFLVDDMGWQDTSVPFYDNEVTELNLRYNTPNMERLAKLGVKFTQAYSCAISSPTRCSLMSGMNASRHRVTNWTLELNQKTDQISDIIELPEWNYNGIQPENKKGIINNSTAITSLPQILKDNGYKTIHCGKAHFGARTTPGADPSQMGFDVNIAGGPNGAPGSYLGTKNFGEGSMFAVKGLEKYHGKDIFLTEALTIEAIKEMKKAVKENLPFYLYMSHYAVHTPIEDDKRFSDNYRGKYDKLLKRELGEKEAKYAALVEGMDKSLGDIMDYIQSDPKLAQNTIILFMSDNGGQALEYCREGTPNRDPNYPARAGKGSAFMGGVREPMIVYWPNITKPNSSCSEKIIIEDFFPTIIEMAGIKRYKTIQKIDGKSFVRCLKNVEDISANKSIVWHFPNLWGETQDIEEGYGAYSSILKGEYHLIYHWQNSMIRLYNIMDDISEQNDLASEKPEIVKQLCIELSDYLREREAQRPKLKASGKPLPYPDEVY